MNKQYCVISHTHWDREWYQSYEMFRMILCDLMDHLLEILEENENYVFHLDAQTVVLEDYLEIHPKRRSEYVGTGMTYKKITEIEKQESYPYFDIGDTYYESQKKLQHAEKAENILFETLTVGDVFFPKNAKKDNDRDKMLEHLSFIENDAEGAEKALREALLKNDKKTVTFILKASKIYNCPITDTLRYYFNDLHITIIRPNTE